MSVVGLIGLSGVGKSFFSDKVSRNASSFTCVKASDLIKSASGEIIYNKLNSRNVEHNQQILNQEFTKFKANYSGRDILIELHNVIETPNGCEFLSEEVFNAIDLTHAVFMQLAPERLYHQRLNDLSKVRRHTSVAELKSLQEKSKLLCLQTFSARKIPFLVLESDDRNNFSEFSDFLK